MAPHVPVPSVSLCWVDLLGDHFCSGPPPHSVFTLPERNPLLQRDVFAKSSHNPNMITAFQKLWRADVTLRRPPPPLSLSWWEPRPCMCLHALRASTCPPIHLTSLPAWQPAAALLWEPLLLSTHLWGQWSGTGWRCTEEKGNREKQGKERSSNKETAR